MFEANEFQPPSKIKQSDFIIHYAQNAFRSTIPIAALGVAPVGTN